VDVREAVLVLLQADADLVALVADRVRCAWLDQADARPAVTITQVSAERGRTRDGHDGLATAALQIDCWADTMAAAVACRDRVVEVLDCYSGEDAGLAIVWAYVDAERDLTEAPGDGSGERVYRVSLDVRVKHRTETDDDGGDSI
jgi:hypothetical protein